jgi:hypothetical protein
MLEMWTSMMGSVAGLERIVDRDGRERVAGRVDDDGIRSLARGLDEIDEAPLVIRLLEYQRCADILSERRAACLNGCECGRAVDVWLPHPQQI